MIYSPTAAGSAAVDQALNTFNYDQLENERRAAVGSAKAKR